MTDIDRLQQPVIIIDRINRKEQPGYSTGPPPAQPEKFRKDDTMKKLTALLLSLALVLGGHWIVALVGWEELLLVSVGLALLGLEVFVIPGFGVAGVAGIVAILASTVLLSVLGDKGGEKKTSS